MPSIKISTNRCLVKLVSMSNEVMGIRKVEKKSLLKLDLAELRQLIMAIANTSLNFAINTKTQEMTYHLGSFTYPALSVPPKNPRSAC